MKIAILLFLFGLSAGAVTKNVFESDPTRPFSLDELLYAKLKSFSARWISDKEISYKNLETDNIMAFDMKDERILVEAAALKKFNCTSYTFSSDNKYLLMRYDDQENYRHSVISKYVIYSLTDGAFMHVASKNYIQHAQWVPQRHAIVYIKDNNIYYTDLDTLSQPFAITETGIPGKVFNGICDWVYEEEILGKGTAISISPDGEQMVFLAIDDREVTEAKFVTYGEPATLKDQYVTQVRIPYPKPGTVISKYQVWHFNFSSRDAKLLSKYQPGREIVYGWNWASKSSLAIVYANRIQNVTQTDLCNLEDGVCKMVYEDKNSVGWANFDVPLFSNDRYLVRVREKVGNQRFYHIYQFSRTSVNKTLITSGNFMVREIVAWDKARRVVFYRSHEPGKPSTDHIYAVPEVENGKPFCITCQVKNPEGAPCNAGSVKFSKGFDYVIASCKGSGPAVTSLYSWNDANEMKLIRMLDTSSDTRKLMHGKLQPSEMDLKVNITNNFEAHVRLILPPNIDTSGKKKYPMIIYVYGGPDNPQVKDYFRFDWSLYLTTNRSIIYGIIDGRGNGLNGVDMMYAVYKALGTVEIQDQINITEYLLKKFDYIDKTRVGIWGWSYGGYATAKVLEEDTRGIFKCGVSVAPVSDWIYYNSIYTERYMDLPSVNWAGYRNASILHNVKNLKNKKLLLMHGTGDDNVHYQHAMHFAKVLERNNIMFEQEAYPDEAHGISGVRPHVYFTMDNFWQRCFNLSY